MPQWLDDILATLRGLSWYEILGIYVVVAFLVMFVIVRGFLFLTRKTKTDLDDRAVAAVRRPVFLTVLFIGINEAMEAYSTPPETILLWSRIMTTVAIVLWMSALMKIGDALLEALARRVDDFQWINMRSLPLFEITAKLLLIGGAIYWIMVTWDKDLTGWLASAGVLGIAIGFAAKDTLANLFAGIFILADAPYKLGDYIVLGSGERGEVTDIGIRSTRIRTRDDIEITLPNGVMANSKIINESGGPHLKRRVRINVGVAYGSDIDKVRAALLEVAEESELFANHPQPSVRFRSFGDSALDFQLRGWIEKPVLHGRAVDQLNTMIYKRFNADGIEIPFPQRDVHVHGTL